MDYSRAYVVMQSDVRKMLGGVKVKGAHRKVPKSSVLLWIETAKAETVASKNGRKTGADKDMYFIPGEVCMKVTK